MIGAVGLLLLAGLIVGFNMGGVRDRMLGTGDSEQIRSLAVLPLENLSGDKDQEYFADGMTDELITDLGKISALRVTSRNLGDAVPEGNKAAGRDRAGIERWMR
jgi:TolB-like protein